MRAGLTQVDLTPRYQALQLSLRLTMGALGNPGDRPLEEPQQSLSARRCGAGPDHSGLPKCRVAQGLPCQLHKLGPVLGAFQFISGPLLGA